MALKVEGIVVKGSVHAEEASGAASRFEPLHQHGPLGPGAARSGGPVPRRRAQRSGRSGGRGLSRLGSGGGMAWAGIEARSGAGASSLCARRHPPSHTASPAISSRLPSRSSAMCVQQHSHTA